MSGSLARGGWSNRAVGRISLGLSPNRLDYADGNEMGIIATRWRLCATRQLRSGR